ncbi:hypothetical protein [Mycobacterium riyadhense]|uniref:PIN-like domain-containing protein n=1 Tax=Mycobacterium riyadhense TaxID=486698 RepID=UPI00195CF6ED|nr:hypothetical protein [Mycobacterium riyadhense]
MRFYVDESAMGLGLALAAARKDTIHCGHPLIPECPRRADDTDWIQAVAARGLVVIARDKKLRTKPVEVQRLWESGLRVFCIGGKRDLSTWEWLVRVVRHWPRMERIIDDSGPARGLHAQREHRRRVRATVGRRPTVCTRRTDAPRQRDCPPHGVRRAVHA